MPEFQGTKLAHDSRVCADFRDIHKIEINDVDRFFFDVPGRVGSGGNSGFQAVNIAAQFGARRIVLIGFDMHTGKGVHWYGLNKWNMANNPLDSHLLRWKEAFSKQVPVVNRMGIEIVNTSKDSALRCFPIKTLEEVVEEWGL